MLAVIFVDEVTYMIALEAMSQFSNMRIVPITLNSDGPDLAELEKTIEEYKFKPQAGKLFWGLYYTIPTFHNPTGILFSDGKIYFLYVFFVILLFFNFRYQP
jgi:DNA-binding transcriptional MocR family regulator